jgi:alanyl-tRNA synthetase
MTPELMPLSLVPKQQLTLTVTNSGVNKLKFVLLTLNPPFNPFTFHFNDLM